MPRRAPAAPAAGLHGRLRQGVWRRRAKAARGHRGGPQKGVQAVTPPRRRLRRRLRRLGGAQGKRACAWRRAHGAAVFWPPGGRGGFGWAAPRSPGGAAAAAAETCSGARSILAACKHAGIPWRTGVGVAARCRSPAHDPAPFRGCTGRGVPPLCFR
ncbi:MAG: hypothetical protein J3K34DRAFT_439772 [Monoraphidium minutum]|nr:MAG: hypothetical protein J3K34DRAFT_439772 [Monoraphidium minutum]